MILLAMFLFKYHSLEKRNTWKVKKLTDTGKNKLKTKEIRRFVNTTYAMNFSRNYYFLLQL